jgi:hypothetical protein
MNVGKETKAFWGDKFIEILDPHKEGHIVRVYPDYWDEKSPEQEQGKFKEWVGLTNDDKYLIKYDADYNQFMTASEYADRVQALTEARLKDKNT